MATTRSSPIESVEPTRAAFATTRWTVVLHAGGPGTPEARLALEDLCRAYWRPIYAFVRRLGHASHDAQDLTQEFFARFLASGSLDRADPAKGRFRSFLLIALKHFLANEWDRARALKRGGGRQVVSFDPTDTDAALQIEAQSTLEPDRLFDRQWALALLERVLVQLREEHIAAGKIVLFEHLKDTLTSDRNSIPYSLAASRLQTTEGAVKVAVHRLRQRYRELLRAEIAQTVAAPTQVEEELRELFAALSG